MIEKAQRPLIDRPRYVYKAPKNVNTENKNKPVNKKNLNKRQVKRPTREVIDKQTQQQMQQPVSGSMNKVGEITKVKPPIKSKTTQKKKTKRPKKSNPPQHKPRAPKNNKDDNGLFKQMKDKFIGKPKNKGGD